MQAPVAYGKYFPTFSNQCCAVDYSLRRLDIFLPVATTNNRVFFVFNDLPVLVAMLVYPNSEYMGPLHNFICKAKQK